VQGQRLTAYEDGRVVVDTPVTTGRPALATDVGAMRNRLSPQYSILRSNLHD